MRPFTYRYIKDAKCALFYPHNQMYIYLQQQMTESKSRLARPKKNFDSSEKMTNQRKNSSKSGRYVRHSGTKRESILLEEDTFL